LINLFISSQLTFDCIVNFCLPDVKDFWLFFLFYTQYVAVHPEIPPKYGDSTGITNGGSWSSAHGICGIMTEKEK